jgi:choline transporter-like protein 2/4/5
MKMFMADVITARAIIFGFGFGMALFFGFVYTYLMSINCLAWLVVWGCVTGVLAFGVAIVSYGQSTLKKWQAEGSDGPHTENQKTWLQIFNYGFMALCVIWFLLMIWFCGAINMAIKCVSMGAKALDEMPIMIFIPILQITGFILFMVPWVYYSLYIASDGEMEMKTFETDSSIVPELSYGVWAVDHEDRTGLKLAWMLFVLFWTMNFIANLGSLVIAHAVSCWYFCKPEDRVETINNDQLWSSYKLVWRFHLGTVAFGSLLIAILQYVRAVALYIQRHVSEEFIGKPWVKVVCCCIHCCLFCLESCMKFISKAAYIQTAIYGTPFCKSAVNVFHLLADNIMRIGAIMITSEGALFIGKIFVTVMATGSSYIFLTEYYEKIGGDDVYEPVGPTILVAIISWMTATMFMDVLHMSIDTIFQCFICDEVSNNGVAAFADDDMKEFVDTHGKMDDPRKPASDQL